MDKKYYIIIIVLVILAFGVIMFFNSATHAKVGNSQVSIPKGYNVTNTTKYSTVLKSNDSTIHIYEYAGNKTIDDMFNDYKKEHGAENVKESSKDMGNNITLRSLTLINSTTNKTIHTNYYYEKDNKIYHIFIKGKRGKNVLESLVNSTQKQIIPLI